MAEFPEKGVESDEESRLRIGNCEDDRDDGIANGLRYCGPSPYKSQELHRKVAARSSVPYIDSDFITCVDSSLCYNARVSRLVARPRRCFV